MEKPIFKIALLGTSGSGKTSLINRYINNTFCDHVSENINNKKPYIKKVINYILCINLRSQLMKINFVLLKFMIQ